MNRILVTVLFILGFFATTYAIGQVYDGKAEYMTAPMDNVIVQHNAAYANVGVAGDDEDLVAQKERYDNMVAPVDNAIDRHFSN